MQNGKYQTLMADLIDACHLLTIDVISVSIIYMVSNFCVSNFAHLPQCNLSCLSSTLFPLPANSANSTHLKNFKL
jgi:hypothetical protein